MPKERFKYILDLTFQTCLHFHRFSGSEVPIRITNNTYYNQKKKRAENRQGASDKMVHINTLLSQSQKSVNLMFPILNPESPISNNRGWLWDRVRLNGIGKCSPPYRPMKTKHIYSCVLINMVQCLNEPLLQFNSLKLNQSERLMFQKM